jgi:glycosyltransferase involved in cell wall biosynthesis
MKILIFLTKWRGGVGVVVNSIKEELEKRGHEVIGISREEDFKCNSLVRNLSGLRKRYKQLIRKERPDVIYTQDWSMAFPLLFPFPIFKKKHYCCFHGNQLGNSKFIQSIVGRIMGERLIVVGDSLKKRFPKSDKVYNGVDLEKFKPLNKKRGCLGWINKDTEVLQKKEILSLAKKIGLKPLIVENFSIPFDKMNSNFYNKCQVFVSLPPKSAGFNLCWVEAMASGVPKILGNEEGIGWKLNIDKIKDKRQLIKKILTLKERNYRKEIRASDLTWKKHADKLEEIFNGNVA